MTVGASIHASAICESDAIGRGTAVFAFAHIRPRAEVGSDCVVSDGVVLENEVVIGDRVTVHSGAYLGEGVTVENDVAIGPHSTFSARETLGVGQPPAAPVHTVIRRGASIGANATIVSGVTVGTRAIVEAGSVVTRDVPDFAVVNGNPARISGYVNTELELVGQAPTPSADVAPYVSKVRGVTLTRLTRAEDLRGFLVAGDVGNQVPFTPKRFFSVFDVPTTEARGAHAHHNCEQFLVCLNGSVRAIVDDGIRREEFELDRPELGLYMPAMTWGTQYKYSADAVLLVMASHHYDAADYIRDYDEFLTLIGPR